MSSLKRILVTGGAGFLGSHLCERLVEQRHDVICLDNFFTSQKTNVSHLLGKPNFELIRHDVTLPIHLEVDEIYNLACPAAPGHYQYNPIKTMKTSVMGAINMLGMSKRCRAKVLQASTSEIYGDPEVHPQPESYRGSVNPLGPRACYDAATEILTEEGWIPFAELPSHVRVATLNREGRVEYHIPDEHIAQPYLGELLRFANTKFDFCVTPNHAMYVRSKSGKLRFLTAEEDRYWPAWRVMTGGEFDGEERAWFELGAAACNAQVHVERVPMDCWLEFLGYFISEGCVHVRRRARAVGGADDNVADYDILIAQENPAGRAKIAACLSKLGFEYFQSGDHQFRICSSHLAAILARLGRSGDKYIPREFLRLSPRQSRILFDALVLGDGSRRGNRIAYYSKSKRLADDVQELALRCGYAASVVSHVVGRDLYRVNIRTATEARLTAPERVPYAGMVYCVNVRNHVICVRRNGRAAWCGNCYDEGKRAAETLFMDYHRMNKVNIRIVRIFNTYGPRMHPFDGRVVSNFIRQALAGEDITIFGEGTQTRSFCYRDDLIEGMMRMMNGPDEFIGPVNLGNPDEFTIKELAELVLEMTGAKSKLVYEPLPEDDPTRRRPDITLAQKHLDWRPTTKLREGLKKTIEWFRSIDMSHYRAPTPNY